MKATDLMIGDWVTLHNYPYGKSPKEELGFNIKVHSVIRDSPFTGIDRIDFLVKDKVEWDYLDDCYPITITPEILEKNGFEKYPYANSYWYCDDMLELFVKIVCIFPIKDRGLHSSLPTPAPRLTAGEDYVYIRCDYVHELQHALKLCGIEKEIVL